MSIQTIDASRIEPGFADPVLDAQSVFRSVLAAMAEPGKIGEVEIALKPAGPLNLATSAVCLALADFDTPAWLDPPAALAADFLRFHCGCPIVDDPADARFAVIAGDLPALPSFAQGSDEYPDTSTTVLFQSDALVPNGEWRLSGPGIRDEARIGIGGLPAGFATAWQQNNALFPRGVDLIITSGRQVCCLPRTTIVRN